MKITNQQINAIISFAQEENNTKRNELINALRRDEVNTKEAKRLFDIYMQLPENVRDELSYRSDRDINFFLNVIVDEIVKNNFVGLNTARLKNEIILKVIKWESIGQLCKELGLKMQF